jgi:hypothetical protein
MTTFVFAKSAFAPIAVGFFGLAVGCLMFVGLAWLGSFNSPPLYMTALAFTAYGVHWWPSVIRAQWAETEG